MMLVTVVAAVTVTVTVTVTVPGHSRKISTARQAIERRLPPVSFISPRAAHRAAACAAACLGSRPVFFLGNRDPFRSLYLYKIPNKAGLVKDT